MTQVVLPVRPVDELVRFIQQPRFDRFASLASDMRKVLAGRRIWHVNSTAAGGGVAELLHSTWGYARGLGIGVRWFVISADPEFVRFAKLLCDEVYGSGGAGSAWTRRAATHYRQVSDANGEALRQVLAPGDVVICHDPQTAGVMRSISDLNVRLIWDCHIGHDGGNAHTARAWRFLGEYLQHAERMVFTIDRHVPAGVATSKVLLTTPAIDPLARKNIALGDGTIHAILASADLVDAAPSAGHDATRSDIARSGSQSIAIRQPADIVRLGQPVSPDEPMVVQVSRWDRLKDMVGVMDGFVASVLPSCRATLLLVGPDVSGIADDPGGARSFDNAHRTWKELSRDARGRVQLVCLPMNSLEENATVVNALQRHAAVVTQKSFAEGFGLTVTEAMWKSRPVVASAVGGITAQIADQVSGVLVAPDKGPAEFGVAIGHLLGDPDRARQIGAKAYSRVLQRYLPDRYLTRYFTMIRQLASGPTPNTDD